jgi:transposase-like protein
MNTLANKIGGRRRKIQRTPEYRARIVEQCAQYGVSVAAVARQHDLNVNVVYRWIRDSEKSAQALCSGQPISAHPEAAFVRIPSALKGTEVRTEPEPDSKSESKSGFIELTLGKSDLQIGLKLPVAHVNACAELLRALLA